MYTYCSRITVRVVYVNLMKFKLLCAQDKATTAAVGANNIVTKEWRRRRWRSRGVETSGPEN